MKFEREDLLPQLEQLRTLTWDGDVMNKSARDELHKMRLIERAHGWNWISFTGVDILYLLDRLKS